MADIYDDDRFFTDCGFYAEKILDSYFHWQVKNSNSYFGSIASLSDARIDKYLTYDRKENFF